MWRGRRSGGYQPAGLELVNHQSGSRRVCPLHHRPLSPLPTRLPFHLSLPKTIKTSISFLSYKFCKFYTSLTGLKVPTREFAPSITPARYIVLEPATREGKVFRRLNSIPHRLTIWPSAAPAPAPSSSSFLSFLTVLPPTAEADHRLVASDLLCAN